MSGLLERHDFPDSDALAKALSQRVVRLMRKGIEDRGRASIAVSGGSTPRAFLGRLAGADLDWSRVTVTLVDERWVPETSERSNTRMLREVLLTGPASAARFQSLYTGKRAPEDGLVLAARQVAGVPKPFDAVILGMGSDGHTASYFSGGDKLAEALDEDTSAVLVPIRASGAGEPRITLTLPVLLATKFLALHIEGQEKAEVLDAALGDGPAADMPVRAVLRQEKVPVHLYWCP